LKYVDDFIFSLRKSDVNVSKWKSSNVDRVRGADVMIVQSIDEEMLYTSLADLPDSLKLDA